ncbi:MAG: hypothetical protein IPL86_03215 [Flavobacteriales bacterium]|nr:hypothetical protein [Flavobacteriales bacterium]
MGKLYGFSEKSKQSGGIASQASMRGACTTDHCVSAKAKEIAMLHHGKP